MNILSACFKFVCKSVADGLGDVTWKVIKKAGKGLLDNFKKRFVHFFADELYAEMYLKSLTEKECYNDSDPLQDAASLYLKNNKNGNREKFINEFTEWIKNNENSLESLSQKGEQFTVGLSIGQQTVYGGEVKNIGIEYHK